MPNILSDWLFEHVKKMDPIASQWFHHDQRYLKISDAIMEDISMNDLCERFSGYLPQNTNPQIFFTKLFESFYQDYA